MPADDYRVALPSDLVARGPLLQGREIRVSEHGSIRTRPERANGGHRPERLGATDRLFHRSLRSHIGRSTQPVLHAFVWNDATQTYADLNATVGASSSMAICVNAGGTVAGVAWSNLYGQFGFVWKAGVGSTIFLSPEGGNIDLVTGINSLGQVIGTYYATGYSNKRGFLWDGTTCTDLGDLGDLGNSPDPYIWPQAINDLGQVVGTSYEITHVGLPVPTAFLWSGGMIGALDGTDDFGGTQAVGLNNSGAVASKYTIPQPQPRPPLTGGFYWFDGVATDLSDLGGGGTLPFWIDVTGKVYGTTFSSDAILHLFGWDADSISDLGAANLSATDLNYQMTSVNAYGEVAGFIHDASNHIQGALGVGGQQYRIASLLPAYLAYTQMSSAYGSQVLINDAGMIACAGTSATGQQMALLLSVDPDTDNDGLPDSWEMQYYGHPVGKNDLAAGGGGLTNWQAYQQGSNPNDFYNGKAPRLTIVSGNSQTASPGSFVPAPLVAQLSNNFGTPASEASVTFSVASGGGQLQASNEASPKTAVSVLTDANGKGKVFFQVSNTAGVTSSINAIPTGTSPSNPPVFQETANNNAPVNPTPTDPDNPPIPQPVPTASYACIDLSSSVQGNDDVNLVALNDSNQAAFVVGNGTPATTALNSFPNYQIYAWQNGQSSLQQSLSNCTTYTGEDQLYSKWNVDIFSWLTSTGQGYGYVQQMEVPVADISMWDALAFPSSFWSSANGSFFLPSPYNNESGEQMALLGVTDQGYIFGAGNCDIWQLSADPDEFPYNYQSGFLSFICDPNGNYVVFDGTTDYSDFDLPNNVSIVATNFESLGVNNKGHAIGVLSSSSTSSVAYWDGSIVSAINCDGYAVDASLNGRVILNDQDQAILQKAQGEGEIWENGTTTVLVNHIPAGLAGQISNIQPFSISNQTVPDTDATIYILATAKVNGTDTTVVCTRDNGGVWSFAQVQPPDGTTISQYTTINSSGTIGGIGSVSNNGTSNNASHTNDDPSPSPTPSQDALVLPKVDISLTFGYHVSTGRDSIEAEMQTVPGFKAPPIIKGDVHTFFYDGKDSTGKPKRWVVQTSTNQDSLVNALETTPYVYFSGHANDGAGFALKAHANDNDFDPVSIDGIDKFMKLRNPKVAIPWRQFYADEYHNFGPYAVPANQIPAQPSNYAVRILFDPPIVDGLAKANNERYPNNPDSNNKHISAGETFPSLIGHGIDQHHMTRTVPDNSDSGAGNYDFLVANVNNSVKPKFGYKIFCAYVCNGARDYGEVFNHGCFISTTDTASIGYDGPKAFVQALVQGGEDKEIIGAFNAKGYNRLYRM